MSLPTAVSWPDFRGKHLVGTPLLVPRPPPPPSLMRGRAVLSKRGCPVTLGAAGLSCCPQFRKRTTTGPRAVYVPVCDYNVQWSSLPVASQRTHRRRAWVKFCALTDRWRFAWERTCPGRLYSGIIPLSRPGEGARDLSSRTMSRYNWRKPGCSGWPCSNDGESCRYVAACVNRGIDDSGKLEKNCIERYDVQICRSLKALLYCETDTNCRKNEIENKQL